MQQNKSEKFWDRVSKFHDGIAKDKNFEKVINISRKYLKPNDKVLDYGCATGLYSIELAKYVKKIHGIDISTKMIKVANEKKMKNTTFSKGTIFDPLESVNIILAFNILHFLKKDVYSRIDDLLEPNGYLISVTPCLREKNTLLGMLALVLTKLKILPNIERFKISELKELIENQFKIIETINLSPSLYFIVAKKKNN